MCRRSRLAAVRADVRRKRSTEHLDFSSTLSNPPHEAFGNFVIVNEGREFFVVDNEEGWAASGIGKKL
jgi:hypothetical protein